MSSVPSPADILQSLIRFDTTNPPGNEKQCITYIADLLRDVGIESRLFSRNSERPNLIARLPGKKEAPPLLLYGHVDVVTTENQEWQHPPFDGRIVDGYIWGRGALDMKGGVAILLSAFLQAKTQGIEPAGDIVFAALSDEEAGGDYGAGFLVEKHPEQFDGIRFAIGEFGGFAMYIGDRTFYPIQVAEKQACWLTIAVRGPSGHGAIPLSGGAMAELARILSLLDRRRLPIRVTPVARQMISGIADALAFPANRLFSQLLNPAMTDFFLKLLGTGRRNIEPMLRNTVNATIVKGGDKINVIPGEVALQLDGRMVPGCSPQDLIDELKNLLGKHVDVRINRYDPGPRDPDMGLFDLLAGIIKKKDPSGTPVPLLLPGVTDGRFFSRLNIQTYGFLPMKLPKDFTFFSTIHAADERIPIDALEFGVSAISDAIRAYRLQK